MGLRGDRRFEAGASISGHERNRLFWNDGRGKFVDVSAVSGLDSPADGRSVARLDFNRDGREDLVVANANEPRTQLFANHTAKVAGEGRFLAVRLQGANRNAAANQNASNRDALGARIVVDTGDALLVRERFAGSGLAAQNSATILIGVGAVDVVPDLTVRWPTGLGQSIENVETGQLLTVYEDPEESASGTGFDLSAYEPLAQAAEVSGRPGLPHPWRTPASAMPRLLEPSDTKSLRLVTTFATWCMACYREIPALRQLLLHYESKLELTALPIDTYERPADLARWKRDANPPYEFLEPGKDTQEAVASVVEETFGAAVTPVMIAVDAKGFGFAMLAGAPTVSELRKLEDR